MYNHDVIIMASESDWSSGEERSNGPAPSKRARISEDGSSCIIHITDEDPNANLVLLRDIESWKTLLLAAKTRGFKAILDIEKTRKEGSVPEVYYHRKCRSLFTMKKSLKAMKQKKKKKVTIPLPDKRRTSVVSTPASRVYDSICIVCEKACKYQKKKDKRAFNKMRRVTFK